MKAAIHVANLGALKRLHQMFAQKREQLCSLAASEKILCGLNHTTCTRRSAQL